MSQKNIYQFFDPTQRSYLGLRSSGIVLQIASIGVVFNPGNLVLPHRADGILHRLVHNRVHRRDKEVQGCQQLLSILCQVPLSIRNSTFCLTSGRRKGQKNKLNPKNASDDSCFLCCGSDIRKVYEEDSPQPESQRCRETPPGALGTCEPSPRSIPQASSGQDMWCRDCTGNEKVEEHLGLYNVVEVGCEGSRKAQDVAVLSLGFTEHLSGLVIILPISCNFVTIS